MVFINPLIEVGLIAAAVFVLFQVVRHKFVDQETQKKVKEKQKEWKAALKSNDKKRAEEMQKELMALQFKVMRGTMPLMFVSLAVLFVVIYPLNGVYVENFPLYLHLPVPFLERTPSWLWFYIIVNIVLSISLAIIRRLRKRSVSEK